MTIHNKQVRITCIDSICDEQYKTDMYELPDNNNGDLVSRIYVMLQFTFVEVEAFS